MHGVWTWPLPLREGGGVVSYLVRNGAYFLQGANGWGQAPCARQFPTEKEAEAMRDRIASTHPLRNDLKRLDEILMVVQSPVVEDSVHERRNDGGDGTDRGDDGKEARGLERAHETQEIEGGEGRETCEGCGEVEADQDRQAQGSEALERQPRPAGAPCDAGARVEVGPEALGAGKTAEVQAVPGWRDPRASGESDQVTPFQVHHGDMFALIRTFADRSIDVAVMDPPYSERQHKGVRSSKRNRLADGNGRMTKAATSRQVDLTFDHWTRDEIRVACLELFRVVRRWVLVFCDDDLWPVWRACAKRAGFDCIKTNVWRRIGGAPQFTGDRPASDLEFIISMHRPGRKRWNGGGYGISSEYVDEPGQWLEEPIVANRSGHRDDRLHTTQKPRALMLRLVELYSDEGETVFDGTAGSGTTGSAAIQLGRRFIGVEKDLEKYHVLRGRLEAEARGLTLQAARRGQTSIFDVIGGV